LTGVQIAGVIAETKRIRHRKQDLFVNEIKPNVSRPPLLKNAPPPELPEGPPDYRAVGRHAVFPETSHDEIARLNFLAQMNRHLSTRVMPFVKAAWEQRVEPALAEPARDRHDVRRALSKDPAFQTWSALRRMTMEQRQQAGRWTALRQAETLAETAAALTEGDPRLALDPTIKIPRYVGAVDHHTMPGSYHKERFAGDVSAAANYDHAIFATTGGLLGRLTDGAGRGIVRWLGENLPDFRPRRILEIGATVGQSLLPIATAFPQAEVIAVDLGAPVLRYGLARAKSLGVENVSFVQADGTDLSRYEDGSFDWVQTTMFLHELSRPSMHAIFAESHRLLRPGGIMIHVEQPQYAPTMPLFEQAMRDWDSFYNNEPFWSTMHGIDLDALMTDVGFASENFIHSHVTAVVDKDIFPDAADDDTEDYGRKASWRLVGAKR
jgi:SAM-dependent methyltransferase